jgi:hypothetical protein
VVDDRLVGRGGVEGQEDRLVHVGSGVRPTAR